MVGPPVQGYRFSDTETSSDSILCRTHHRTMRVLALVPLADGSRSHPSRTGHPLAISPAAFEAVPLTRKSVICCPTRGLDGSGASTTRDGRGIGAGYRLL